MSEMQYIYTYAVRKIIIIINSEYGKRLTDLWDSCGTLQMKPEETMNSEAFEYDMCR